MPGCGKSPSMCCDVCRNGDGPRGFTSFGIESRGNVKDGGVGGLPCVDWVGVRGVGHAQRVIAHARMSF